MGRAYEENVQEMNMKEDIRCKILLQQDGRQTRNQWEDAVRKHSQQFWDSRFGGEKQKTERNGGEHQKIKEG